MDGGWESLVIIQTLFCIYQQNHTCAVFIDITQRNACIPAANEWEIWMGL